MRNKKWGDLFWSGGVRFSLLGFYVIVVLLFFFFAWQGKRWWSNGDHLQALDSQIQNLEHEVAWLEERGAWTLGYFRIYKGLDVLSLKRITPRQKQMMAERLWVLARDYNFDPLLVLAIVAHESRGNPWARGQFRSGSESGALGLMQLKHETAAEIAQSFGVIIHSEQDLFKPEVNLVLGTAYLMKLMARYGNVSHAIMAYNIGPGAMDSRLRQRQQLPVAYYESVMRSYRKLLVLLDEW